MSDGFDVKWLLEKRVGYIFWHGNVDMEIVKSGIKHLMDLLESGDSPLVHIIFDNSQARYDITAIEMSAVSKKLLTHPKMGWGVVVGLAEFKDNFAVNVTAQVAKMRYKSTNTVEEAIAFLQEADSSLPIL